jgi:hypothetical protein
LWDKGDALSRKGCILEYNKRVFRPEVSHSDYGLGVLLFLVLKNALVSEIFDLARYLQKISVSGALAGHEAFQCFYEIASHGVAWGND